MKSPQLGGHNIPGTGFPLLAPVLVLNTNILFNFFFIDVEEHRLNGEKVFFGSRTVIPNNNNAKLASEVSKITQYSLIHFQNAF